MPCCLQEKAPAEAKVLCVLPVPSSLLCSTLIMPGHKQAGRTELHNPCTLHWLCGAVPEILQPFPQTGCIWELYFLLFFLFLTFFKSEGRPHPKTPTKKRHGACYFSTFCYVVPVSNSCVPLLPGPAVQLQKEVTVRPH